MVLLRRIEVKHRKGIMHQRAHLSKSSAQKVNSMAIQVVVTVIIAVLVSSVMAWEQRKIRGLRVKWVTTALHSTSSLQNRQLQWLLEWQTVK